jgi:hypothetical protein
VGQYTSRTRSAEGGYGTSFYRPPRNADAGPTVVKLLPLAGQGRRRQRRPLRARVQPPASSAAQNRRHLRLRPHPRRDLLLAHGVPRRHRLVELVARRPATAAASSPAHAGLRSPRRGARGVPHPRDIKGRGQIMPLSPWRQRRRWSRCSTAGLVKVCRRRLFYDVRSPTRKTPCWARRSSSRPEAPSSIVESRRDAATSTRWAQSAYYLLTGRRSSRAHHRRGQRPPHPHRDDPPSMLGARGARRDLEAVAALVPGRKSQAGAAGERPRPARRHARLRP